MTEAEWLANTCAYDLLMREPLNRTASLRKARLCGLAFCNLVKEKLPNDACRKLLEMMEIYMEGGIKYKDIQVQRRLVENETLSVVGWSSESEKWNLWCWNAIQNVTDRDRGKVMSCLSSSSHLDPDQSASLGLVYDIFGNPFRPVAIDPAWRTSTVLALAQQMYESRDFVPIPILADALQDAGCENDNILNHCRSEGPHVRGCWVVDLLLGKA